MKPIESAQPRWMHITLPASLTIAELSGLKLQIDEAMTWEVPLLVELGEVDRIDSAGMQCLLALSARVGPMLRFRGASEAVNALAALYNLSDALALLIAHPEPEHA